MPGTVVHQLLLDALAERIRTRYCWSASLHNQDVAALHRADSGAGRKEHS